VSKTWHDKKTRLSYLKGRDHEHNTDGPCVHCGKPPRGGKKRERMAVTDSIERALRVGKYTNLTHLLVNDDSEEEDVT